MARLRSVRRLATIDAAKAICSNVFIAHRDVDAIVRDNLGTRGHRIFNHIRIDVDRKAGSVSVRYLGLFAEGRGVSGARGAGPPAQAAGTDAIGPEGGQALQGPGMRAIVVVHDGRIIAETYRQGFSASTPLQGWPMTKAVTAALIGLAIGDGKLSFDRKRLFPQRETNACANISLADLMSMSAGLKWNEDEGLISDSGRMAFLANDATAYLLTIPLEAPPGAKLRYFSGEGVLLSRLWMDAGGAVRRWPGWLASLVDLPREALISEALSRAYDGLWLREPGQFLHDALPRA